MASQEASKIASKKCCLMCLIGSCIVIMLMLMMRQNSVQISVRLSQSSFLISWKGKKAVNTTRNDSQSEKAKLIETHPTSMSSNSSENSIDATPSTDVINSDLGGGPSTNLTCKFPLLQPLDKSILKYVSHPRSVECKVFQPYLTFLDESDRIRINNTEWHNINDSQINCTFREIDRANGKDDKAITRSNPKKLIPSVAQEFGTDTAEVICENGTNGTQIYYNLHAKPANISKTGKAPSEDQLSVLMFILDSTALNMFRRHLNRTYAYLTQRMGAFVFRGYTKVADNTFPNMIPVLVGKRIDTQQEDMPDELGLNYTDIYYDDWDLIWKYFANKSYLTAFIEDEPDYGIFHYTSKGFTKKPVDWYFHPYFVVRHSSKWNDKGSEFCFGNTPKYQQQVDLIRRIMKKCQKLLHFTFSFFTELSHSTCCDIERVDDLYAGFFEELHRSNYLNKSVIIITSDHGHRFASIRQTQIGLLEERMPMFGVIFPPWFYRLHPNIKANLAKNQYRLSSTFDVHETLLDIANANYNGHQRALTARGLSQLYEIPLNRTCTAAGIPEFFCTCTEAKPIKTSDTIVIEMGNHLIGHLNNLLVPVMEKCIKLKLKKIKRAETFLINQGVLHGILDFGAYKKYQNQTKTGKATTKDTKIRQYRILIEAATPSNALFESLIHYNIDSKSIHIPNDVSRINQYGNQSHCIRDVRLRKYCFCKDLVR